MAIYIVKTGGETLRVREEEFGCTIWSKDKYAEGDKTTLDILRRLSEGDSVDKIAEDLAREHDVPIQQIFSDLLSMFQELSKAGWFSEEVHTLEEKL